MRDQSRQPGYEKDRVAELVSEPEVSADGRDCTVDIDRQGSLEALCVCVERALARADQPYMLALQLELQRHLEQPRRARVACVETVTESRRHLVRSDAFGDDLVGGLLDRHAAAHVRQAAVEESHARLDVASMMRTEGEDARRYAILERRARRCDVARGECGRRRHTVIYGRHEHSIQHAPDGW